MFVNFAPDMSLNLFVLRRCRRMKVMKCLISQRFVNISDVCEQIYTWAESDTQSQSYYPTLCTPLQQQTMFLSRTHPEVSLQYRCLVSALLSDSTVKAAYLKQHSVILRLTHTHTHSTRSVSTAKMKTLKLFLDFLSKKNMPIPSSSALEKL